MTPMHLGHLPWWEQVLVYAIVGVPFLVLGALTWYRSRHPD